ncbi:MAG TPA: long-chain fatty acid--CoA ligase [Solirubrobacterales bacterium]|nr:long-chain fatty acid--CoA ligase [Solirubrobacterales bacterium]
MQDYPLLVRHVAERAEQVYPDRELVTRTATGTERSTYREVVQRARRLASALTEFGIKPGDRVATFAWNSIRHLELYLAVPSMGAVLHTLNIRLFEDDLRYIVEHADDKVIFLDATLAGLMPKFAGDIPEILMPDGPGEREGATGYEDFLAGGDPGFQFPDLDENSAAAMCFTSGTTGKPKGVVYSHRSTVLHSLVASLPDNLNIHESDSMMPIVPMFHVNAWGIPYAAALNGARQVFPGPKMDPASVAEMIVEEKVTRTAGVPTIWNGILQLDPKPDFSSVEEIIVGGSAVSETLLRAYDEQMETRIVQAWGMTETSPIGLVSRIPAGAGELSKDEEYAIRSAQGRAVPLVDVRIDEEAGGELQVRGPWIARDYFDDPEPGGKFTEDGWLRTGDVARYEEFGIVKLVDRTKDLVKSGGEWISSVELENEIMAHPDVLEAAVIAVPDEKWDERPCACIVLREGTDLSGDAVREFLEPRVAKWWIPERIEFIAEVPKTSVGKFDKKVLRAQFT